MLYIFLFFLHVVMTLLVEEDNTDIDDIQANEAKTFPDGNTLVEEDENEVDNTTEIEDAITKESTAVHLAVGEHSDATSDDRGNEHTSTHIRTYTNFSHSTHNRDDEREDIGSTITEGEEGNTYLMRTEINTYRQRWEEF